MKEKILDEKSISLLLVLLMLCGIASGCAAGQGGMTPNEEPAETHQSEIGEEPIDAPEAATGDTIDDTPEGTQGEEPDDGVMIPEVGDVINGFEVVDVQPLGIRGITMVYMEHQKTGAKLVYGACDDLERGFSVAFRTLAPNDSGMPHVFEHSCLSGSEKYPDPSLFFSMLDQTYVTFLNAMTYPTVTIYPVTTLSEEQLAKNIDYNLNGVFKPLLLSDERSMMREAYRYELADKDGDITLNGTVYSEMKGEYTLTSAAQFNTLKLLYPGSYTAKVAGGIPEDIITMTQQDLIDFHSTYYRPANAMFTLHGKLDIARFLKQIDEFLSDYEDKNQEDVKIEDAGYVAEKGYREQLVHFATTADSSAMTSAYYAYELPEISAADAQRLLFAATSLIVNGGTVSELAKERMPGAMVGVNLVDHTPSRTLMFSCDSLTEEQIPVFKSVIEEGIAVALSNGLDKAKLVSINKNAEYLNFDTSQSVNYSQDFVQNVPVAWGNIGDMYEFSRQQQVQSELRGDIDNGTIDAVFSKYLSAPENSVMCATIPENGAIERNEAELNQSLKDKKAAMTEDEIAALVERTADFAAWTEANAKNSMIDQMKVVNVRELPEEMKRYTAEDTQVEGMRVISSQIDTGEIVDVKLIFDASTVPVESLHDYMLATTLLKNMPTANYNSAELNGAVMDCMGSLSASSKVEMFNDYTSYQPIFDISWRTTRADLQKSFELVNEIMYNTDWNNADELCRLIDQGVTMDKLLVPSMPDVLASAAMEAYIDSGKNYTYYLSGFEYQEKAAALVKLSDEELIAEAQKLKNAIEELFNKNGFIFACVGTDEGIAEATAYGLELYNKLQDTKRESVNYDELIPRPDKPMAIVVDGDIQYNYMAINLRDCGIEKNEKYYLLADIVTSKILRPNLRFIGGAYGVACKYDYPLFVVFSYRDPNLTATYDYYRSAAEEIRNLEITQEDIDGFIAPYFSSIYEGFSPVEGATCAISDVIRGDDTFTYYINIMHELKEITPQDVKAFAEVFDMLAEHGKILSVGGAASIEKNKDMFDVINTYYANGN